MHLISADFAVEWLRPMTPNAKLVGPILPQAAQPLPQELEVCTPAGILHFFIAGHAPWTAAGVSYTAELAHAAALVQPAACMHASPEQLPIQCMQQHVACNTCGAGMKY